MNQLPDSYGIFEISCMDVSSGRCFVYKAEYIRLSAKNAQQAERIKELEHDRQYQMDLKAIYMKQLNATEDQLAELVGSTYLLGVMPGKEK